MTDGARGEAIVGLPQFTRLFLTFAKNITFFSKAQSDHLSRDDMVAEQKTYSRAEVKEHSTNKSAWVIINNKIFDVTKFLDEVGDATL